MASLKSSVGSKSTTAHHPTACDSTGLPPTALRSTWISRLRLRSLPDSFPPPPRVRSPAPAATAGCPDLSRRNTVSTVESRIPPAPPKPNPLKPLSTSPASRYPLFFSRNPPAVNDNIGPSTRHNGFGFGFGPFRVRSLDSFFRDHDAFCQNRACSGSDKVDYNHRQVSFPFLRRIAGLQGDGIPQEIQLQQKNLDNGRSLVRLSPPPHLPLSQMNCRVSESNHDAKRDLGNGTRIIETGNIVLRDDELSSYTLNRRMINRENIPDEGPSYWQYGPQELVDPWISSASAQHVLRSRGASHVEDENAAVAFCDTLPQHSTRQMASSLNEPEEPFSHWNMGRFKRKSKATSVHPDANVTSISGRKRHSNLNNWVFIKSRKLRNVD